MAIPPSSPPSQPPTLPPASTFDILPSLHELLSGIDPTAAEPSHYSDLTPLDPKDLPNEILLFKQKIRNALKVLREMPDMERSCEEQEEEIKELEERRREQEEMARKMGSVVAGLKGRILEEKQES